MTWLRDKWEYVVGFFCGCGWPSGGFEYRAVKLLGSGPCVNSWWRLSPWAIMRALYRAGCNACCIELLGWSKDKLYGTPEKIEGPYREWIAAARHYRRTLLVKATNDNLGSGQHGDPGVPLSHYTAQIKRAHEIVMKQGPKGVLYQAVGECGSAAGQAFERWAMPDARAHQFVIGTNHDGRYDGGLADISIHHPSRLADKGTAGELLVTDGLILLELCIGGDYMNNGFRKDVWRRYAAECVEAGRGCIGYVFGVDEPDYASIEALKGLRK